MKLILVFIIFHLFVSIIISPFIMLSIIKNVKHDRKLKKIYNSENKKNNINANTNTNNKYWYYSKKQLLTNHEKYYYNALIGYANKYNFHLLAKVRLADLVEADERNYSKKQFAFYKIQAKHIDFALCDKSNLEPVLIIEIDDNTHNDAERIKRDNFVDEVLNKTGYKIVHLKGLKNIEYTLNYILGIK
ncbi:MAG: DUF2726 domain-containing protein [Ruminococcaceae bacterium]|nr:DUF2726 domain-containing protein [Oscillospiraceae bacterium]